MSMKLLKRWISLILESDVIGEPDLTNKKSRDRDKEKDDKKDDKQTHEMSAGGVAGVTTPLGTGPTYPEKLRKKAKQKKQKK
jgi:hypothetical protein